MANPYEDKPSIVQEIIDSVKIEGFTEDTPEAAASFERRKNQLHVLKCREIRGLSTCLECIAADHCTLYARVRFDHYFK